MQALSYGTTLLASPETLRGFPHLGEMPQLPLDDPDACAGTVARLIGDRWALTELSELQLDRQRSLAAAQPGIWSRTLAAVPGP